MKVMHLLACENEKCDKTFGGPGEDGFVDGWSEVDIRNEALDMNWIGLTIRTDDLLFCSKKCVAQWLRNHKNDVVHN